MKLISRLLDEVEYDKKEKILTISFLNGKKYEFICVYEKIYKDICQHGSPSWYFNRYIKNSFAHRRLQ